MTWNKTIEKSEKLKSLVYKVVSITSCQWLKQPESKKIYTRERNPTPRTMTDILKDIKTDKIFGCVKCSLHVPDELKSKFSEFPPIFKNTEITLNDVGEHMRAYCRTVTRKNGVKGHLSAACMVKIL